MATAARLQKELQALQEERDSLRRKIVEARRQWQEHVTEVLVPPGLVEATIDSRLPFRAIVGFIGGLALAVGLYLRRFRRRAESREYQVERVNTLSTMPVLASMNPVPRMAPAPQRSPSPPASPLAALLAARKPSPAESTSLDPLRDKADRAARLARLKSLTQSPTLAPHSV